MSAGSFAFPFAAGLCHPAGGASILPVAMRRDADQERRFRALFEESYDFVWRVLRRFGVPEGATDDAAQDVFVIVARRLDDIAPGKERPFLYGTARRVAADVRRARGRSPDVESDSKLARHPDAAPSPEQVTAESEARALLERVLDAMADDERAVFVLFELEGLPKSEVAVALGIPEGTTASRLRRAREVFFAMTAEHESAGASTGGAR